MANVQMEFPGTWEEYEKDYGFNDSEEIYTNNARFIPSFRVKQWLDHLSSIQPKTDVLDKIRAEIEDKSYLSYDDNPRHIIDESWVLDIIDKYKAEQNTRDH